MLMRRATASV